MAPLPEDRPGHGGQAAALLELLIAGRGPAAFNRTMESTNRCEVCRKPIPLSRSLCPICAGRSGVHAAEGQGLPHEPGDSGRVSHRFRSAGIGVAMFLLLAVGAFAWRGGSAWRTADQPAVAEAPAKNLAASLPRGGGHPGRGGQRKSTRSRRRKGRSGRGRIACGPGFCRREQGGAAWCGAWRPPFRCEGSPVHQRGQGRFFGQGGAGRTGTQPPRVWAPGAIWPFC